MEVYSKDLARSKLTVKNARLPPPLRAERIRGEEDEWEGKDWGRGEGRFFQFSLTKYSIKFLW